MLAVAVLLAMGHTGAWFWAAATLERSAAAFLAAPPAPGWQVSAGAPVRDGWPSEVRIRLPDIAVSGRIDEIASEFAWRAAALVATVSLRHPRTLLLDVRGRQVLRPGQGAAIPIAAERLRVVVPLEPGVPVRAVMLEVVDLRAGLPGGPFELARLDLRVETRPAATQGEAAMTIMLAARDIRMPQGGASPAASLGPLIAALSAEAILTGPMPRLPLHAARLEEWRDGGGAVELRRLALGWGRLEAAGSATLALDDQLQPMGAATARIAGHADLLDALAAVGTLPPRSLLAAKAVLGLMVRPDPQGGPPVVEVPLSLQNRTLAVGRIPLARIPLLLWPDGP